MDVSGMSEVACKIQYSSSGFSNLVEKGAQKHKSDFTEGPSATKSLKCFDSNEDVQHVPGGYNQSQRQNEKVGHKIVFPVLYNAFNYLKICVPLNSYFFLVLFINSFFFSCFFVCF